MRRIDEQRVAELTLAGWPIKKIARELGCARSSVSKARRRLGLVKSIDDALIRDREMTARVIVMTKNGWSARRIATSLQCHERTVTRIRKKLGIARPPSRWLTAEEVDLAERLLADGCSIAEVERTLGRAQGSLSWRFKGRGWTHQEISEFGGLCSRMARLERA